MERALVSAATGVLSPVIGKLAKLLERKYDRFTGVRREVTSLRGELVHMHAFLQKLSWVEHPDEQAKLWMMEVKELSYDIEDSVDEFLLRVDGKTGLEGFRGFMRRIANFFIKIRTRWRIGKEIEGLQVLVKRARELRLSYKIDDNISEPHDEGLDSRVCSIFKDTSEFVGIDGPKEELISMLIQGDEVENQELKVFSIVGPGGLGKTTLANQVYNAHGKKFECHAFVTVSRNPNVMNILRSIHSQVAYSCPTYGKDEVINLVSDSVNPSGMTARAAPQFHEYHEDQQLLMTKILNFLRNKRYFIVIDDIWEVRAWKIIKCVLPIDSCGSIVITTTRKNEVAENCCFQHPSHIYALRGLNLEDSKRLFLQRIFGHGQHCPSHLESICSTILKKCGGLPLALIVVAGLLANKAHTADQWNRVQNSIGHGMQRSDQHVIDMYTVLSLSYFDLPHHLKSCLLYLSIFPENYAVYKKRLVRNWIAEGFVPEEQDYTMYESGEKCFYELINRYLLRPTRTNKFGQVKVCRVHDIILDFIVSKSTEENFISLVGTTKPTRGQEKKVRRISVQGIDQECNTSLTGLILCHARSVTVFGDLGNLPGLSEFRIIRLLDLQDCDLSKYNHGLDSIGKLFSLKYLNLKNTNLSQLPKKIVELQNLETLNIKRNSIRQLPKSVVRLRQMICLLIDVNVKLPNGIGKMQALQELKHISLLEQPSIFAKELSQLTDLKELSLSLEPNDSIHTGRYNECTETMVSSICRLGTLNLHSLSISIGEGCDDGFLQREWCPPPSNLRRFVIKRKCPVSRVPSWLDSSLVNLQELCLHMKAVKQEDIQMLGAMPALHRLVLYVQADDQDGAMVSGSSSFHLEISGSHGFSLLKYLKIDGTDPRRLGLRFQAGSMPKLEELVLMFKAFGMPDLKDVDLVFGLEHLERLAVFICEIDCYPPVSITWDVEEAVQGVEGDGPVEKLINILSRQLQDTITTADSAPPEDLVEAIRRICTTHPKCPKHIIRKTGKNPLSSLLEFWLVIFVRAREERGRSESNEISWATVLILIATIAIIVLAVTIRSRERDNDEVTPATSDNEFIEKFQLDMPFLLTT